MNAATLLSLALSLLIAAQQPNVPQALKDQAISVAQTAIAAASGLPTSVATTTTTSGLQITNFVTEKTETTVTMTWQTTLPSRSRLTFTGTNSLTGQVYESLNGIGTSHRVVVDTLAKGNFYSYTITARSVEKNIEDDLYGSFDTGKSYRASFVKKDPDCAVFTVKDLAGRFASNYRLVVGWYDLDKGKKIFSEAAFNTNTLGEASYCSPKIDFTSGFTFKGENLITP